MSDALKDAGDNWLSIGDETWNAVRNRELEQQKEPDNMNNNFIPPEYQSKTERIVFSLIPSTELTARPRQIKMVRANMDEPLRSKYFFFFCIRLSTKASSLLRESELSIHIKYYLTHLYIGSCTVCSLCYPIEF